MGGGIFNGGTLFINNSTFSGNHAGFGGGIYSEGALAVANSSFSNNNNADYDGGALWNTAPGRGTVITNSTFSSNHASNGAGIRNYSGKITVTNSTFSGNTALGAGGGLNNTGRLIVANSTFSGNNGGIFGGGIANENSALTFVTNSTFSGNTSLNYAHSIWANSGSVSLKSTILAGSPIYECSATAGTIIDAGYNISDDATCGFSASTSHSNTDAKLDPAGLSNNGGPTQTIALQPSSPARCVHQPIL